MTAFPVVLYIWSIVDEDGALEVWPTCAWPSAAIARQVAASFIADRQLDLDEADELMEWTEHPERLDGKYSLFTAPTKLGREVRVWPIEFQIEPPTDTSPSQE